MEMLLSALTSSEFVLDDKFDYKTDGDRIYFKFDTKWEPPVDDINRLACVFPALNILLEFCEPGMHFKGRVGWHGGKQILNIREDFDGDSIEAWKSWDRSIDKVITCCDTLKTETYEVET